MARFLPAYIGSTKRADKAIVSLIRAIPPSPRHVVCAKLGNESGASIIMALSFFLICAIIGVIVLTAASINAQQVVDHRVLQQENYSVSSAAQLIGEDLQKGQIEMTYPSGATGAALSASSGAVVGSVKPDGVIVTGSKLALSLYGNGGGTSTNAATGASVGSVEVAASKTVRSARFDQIWDALARATSYAIGTESAPITVKPPVGASVALSAVYAIVTVEKDFSVTVHLSRSATMETMAAFNETVSLKSIPTYDETGNLTKVNWESPIISKTGSAT